MKKEVKIGLICVGFSFGVLFGVASNLTPPVKEAPKSQVLEGQIQKYEQAVAQGQEFTPTYSEHTSQEEVEKDKNLAQQVNSPAPQTPSQQTKEIGHNAVSQFGRGMGEFLRALVRSLLRSIVRFVDQLIST